MNKHTPLLNSVFLTSILLTGCNKSEHIPINIGHCLFDKEGARTLITHKNDSKNFDAKGFTQHYNNNSNGIIKVKIQTMLSNNHRSTIPELIVVDEISQTCAVKMGYTTSIYQIITPESLQIESI